MQNVTIIKKYTKFDIIIRNSINKENIHIKNKMQLKIIANLIIDINKVNIEKSIMQLQVVKNPVIKIGTSTNKLQLATHPILNIIINIIQIKSGKHIHVKSVELRKDILHKTIQSAIMI